MRVQPLIRSHMLLLALPFCLACTKPEVEFVIVQVNDVYEIGTVDGRPSPLALLAGLLKDLEEPGVEVLSVLAGDFVSPSAVGEARVYGEALHGRQMVDVLNAVGLDFAVLGNHEFDLDQSEFEARRSESDFVWLGANLRDASTLDQLGGVKPWDTVRVRASTGIDMVIAFIGLTIPDLGSASAWISADTPLAAMRTHFPRADSASDFQVALTHLDMEYDVRIAREVRGLDLVLGGHDHEGGEEEVGPSRTRITKARANAENVWVHRIRFNTLHEVVTIESRTVSLDPRQTPGLAPDTAVQRLVERWFERAFVAFEAEGINPRDTAGIVDSLDGREVAVRHGSNTLTHLIADAMLRCAGPAGPLPRLALYNAGGIRIDDVIRPGPITEYDVLRILPYRGAVVRGDVTGDVLTAMLDRGRAGGAEGEGHFLQSDVTIGGDQDAWTLDGTAVDPGATYTLVLNDFLALIDTESRFPRDGSVPLDTIAEMRLAVISQIRGDTTLDRCMPESW